MGWHPSRESSQRSMKKREIDNHPLIAPLSLNDRDAVWHGFREKYPNRAWGFVYFGMWVIWAFAFMVLAQFLDSYIDAFGWRLFMHFIVTFCIGVVGGVIVIGSFMLPKRRREYYDYLSGKTWDQVKEDLELSELEIEQAGGHNGRG